MIITGIISACLGELNIKYLKEISKKITLEYEWRVDKMLNNFFNVFTVMSLMGYPAGVPRGLRPAEWFIIARY